MNISEQQTHTILNAVDVMSLVIHGQSVIFANELAMIWLDKQEIIGTALLTWIAAPSRRAALNAYRQITSGESEVVRGIYLVKLANGQAQTVEASIKIAAFLGEDHHLISFRPLTTTANQQMDSHESLHSSAAIVSSPVLGELIFEQQIVDKSLNQFLETLQTIIPYESASIALVNQGKMEFIAARGLENRVNLAELNQSHQVISPKIAPISEGKIEIVADTHTYPHWVPIKGTEYIRSWMGVPLHYEDKFIGVLNLDHSQANFFNALYAQYALAMAQQASTAIVYTRLYEEAKRDLDERQRLQTILIKNLINTETLYAAQQILFESESLDECLDDVLAIIGAALDDTQFILVVFNTKSDNLLHFLETLEDKHAAWKVFAEISGAVNLAYQKKPSHDIRWQKTVRELKDGRHVRAAVVNKRGLLIAVRAAAEEDFAESDQEFINTIASQITLAVENEMLYEELRQYSQQLERLAESRSMQLAVEQRRLQAILDATAEGIFYMENFLIQYANPAFCRMVGYPLEELYGKPLSFLRVMPEMPEQHNFNALLDNPMEVEVGRSETRLRSRDGHEFHASIRFSLVGQPGENPVRMVAIGRDVSQERKLYFQRARFIANAAHELRTPLSSLVLRLHLLRRQPERINDHLDSLDKVTTYLRQLVEQLLDLSRFERGSIQLDRDTFILQELLKQAVQEHLPFAEEEGISVQVAMPEPPIIAKVDGIRMVQAIGNLIVNAINYNNRGGEINIVMRRDDDLVGNHTMYLEVQDNGAGIDAELLPDDIFEPFSRPSQGTRKETGMGLALVREIVHLHGGLIYAMSKDNEGSKFEIRLPLE